MVSCPLTPGLAARSSQVPRFDREDEDVYGAYESFTRALQRVHGDRAAARLAARARCGRVGAGTQQKERIVL